MPTEPHTLRRRLLTWLLVPMLTLFFLRGGYTYYYAAELANHVYDRMLLTLTNSISQQVVYHPADDRIELLKSGQDLLLSDEIDSLYFAIRDAQGNIVDGDKRMPPSPAGKGLEKKRFFDGSINGQDVRITYLPIIRGNKPYVLQIAETLEKRSVLSHEFKNERLVPQIIIIIFVTIIVWFVIGRSLAPLKRLQTAVSERSHLDLSPLHDDSNFAEVQPLVHSINDLMQRLSDVLDSHKRFIADAAHQLRTPLAGLKTQIELASRQNDPSTLPATLRSLLASTDRMTRLVNQLLALARNEPKADSAVRKDSLDLGLLALNATMEWVPRALEKDIDLGFESPNEKFIIQCDAARIKDMIDNLIDNAVRYTPTHGRITVSMVNNGKPQLVVTDNGPGIPTEQRERVFERFYSVLGNGAEGSGLGLAIVREIVRIHDGEIRIDTPESGTGTRISVAFTPLDRHTG